MARGIAQASLEKAPKLVISFAFCFLETWAAIRFYSVSQFEDLFVAKFLVVKASSGC